MRKKLILVIGVFLFVLVFSFFGAPVYAADSSYDSSASIQSVSSVESMGSYDDKVSSSAYYVNFYSHDSSSYMSQIDLTGLLDGVSSESGMYRVNVTSVATVNITSSIYMTNFDINCRINGTDYNFNHFGYKVKNTTFTNTNTFDMYLSDDPGVVSPYYFGNFNLGSSFTIDLSASCVLTVNSIEVLSAVDSDAYQEGYEAGYTAGESAGYSSGYSDGYTAGETSGYDEGYDDGYTAGSESIDTDSYYDAGYAAGEASGYDSGYDEGYDSGYAAAMARIESWGADTSEYPLEIGHFIPVDGSYSVEMYLTNFQKGTELDYTGFYSGSCLAWYNLPVFDSTHTYRFVIQDVYFELESYMLSPSFYICLGSNSYPMYHYGSNLITYSFNVPGDSLSDTISFSCSGTALHSGSTTDTYPLTPSVTIYYSDIYIYDLGPAGNLQNQIANQTDDLTNGYDSSAGETAASSFADNAAKYETTEGSIFTSARSSLDDYTFFNIESVPAVVTGLSFVSSTMTSIFNAMGGASGAGIVLSVLFSVMIVSIVIGLYRYFVSSGHSKGSSKGGKK